MMENIPDGVSGGNVFLYVRVIGIGGGILSKTGGCEDGGWTTRHGSKEDGVMG